MNTIKLKTTIKCAGCIAKATPFLNTVAGEENWAVDIQNPDKILTVSSSGELSTQEIIKAVQEAGFKAEQLKQ